MQTQSGDQEGAPEVIINTDIAACLGCSPGLTVPRALRSPCECCVGTLAVRGREGEGCVFLQASRGEGIL